MIFIKGGTFEMRDDNQQASSDESLLSHLTFATMPIEWHDGCDIPRIQALNLPYLNV
jgi:hypothetical protein